MEKIFRWIHKNPYLGLSKKTEMSAVYTVITLLFLGYLAVVATTGIMEMLRHGPYAVPSPAHRFLVVAGGVLLLLIFCCANHHYNTKGER